MPAHRMCCRTTPRSTATSGCGSKAAPHLRALGSARILSGLPGMVGHRYRRSEKDS
jgi:hypothetical protein